eukprot:6193642-Pleurochrysis_carterae.AAC.5
MVRLQDAHFYPKVPRDLSEATKLGGLVSLLAIGTIVWLVYEQVNMYTAVRQVTKMELDRSSLPTPLGAYSLRKLSSRIWAGRSTIGEEAFESIRVNFNISVLRIPCQYASLQAASAKSFTRETV